MHINDSSLPVTQNLAGKIIRNTFFNITGRMWGLAIGIILTPYIIKHIGVERFGIWAIAGIVTSHIGLLDFGIGGAFAKYIAEFHAKKDQWLLNSVIITGFLFYLSFSLIILPFAYIFMDEILALFSVNESFMQEAQFVFKIGLIIFGFASAFNVFSALQIGLQRMDIMNKIMIVLSVVNAAGTVVFLESGYGLKGLIINNAILFVIGTVINIVVAKKIFPGLSTGIRYISLKTLKLLFGFGVKIHVNTIAVIGCYQTDKLLAGYFLDLKFVTFFSLASQILNRMRTLPAMLTSAILPAVSELSIINDYEVLKRFLFRGAKYLAFFSVPVTFFIFISAPEIMYIWVGNGYEASVVIIRILVTGYCINFMSYVSTAMAAGIGMPHWQMWSGVVGLLLNIPVSIMLFHAIGYPGLACGTTIAAIAGVLYMVVGLNRFLGISLSEYFNKSLKIPIVMSLPGFVIYFITRVIITRFIPHELSRWTELGIFVFNGFLFSSIYIYLSIRFEFLGQQEFEVIKKIPFLNKIIKKRQFQS